MPMPTKSRKKLTTPASRESCLPKEELKCPSYEAGCAQSFQQQEMQHKVSAPSPFLCQRRINLQSREQRITQSLAFSLGQRGLAHDKMKKRKGSNPYRRLFHMISAKAPFQQLARKLTQTLPFPATMSWVPSSQRQQRMDRSRGLTLGCQNKKRKTP
ncbi:hypothetical protein Pyn_30650 [Prunus yedoensis var. nudiflora]|uniref:Uncharacterized protein n=1 Tax=Prunus yedoensis var. nudiflora TaxID=2094558 RepID=A0A314XX11_PRUYE|nr:hypothetical protein Pyn_30650 [Prunus yedoensis var. nudiflora]